MGRSRRKALPPDAVARIESLTSDGRGVTHIDGKAVFVHGGLPGEEVRFAYTRAHRRHDEGEVRDVITPSPDRVQPRCAHFGVCGGCSLQHLDPAAQIRAKQRSLVEALEHIGKVQPQELLPPLESPSHWGYRRKARLGVKYVVKKDKVVIGFRERGGSFVADLTRCEVLHPRVGHRIEALSELIYGLSTRDRIPQIEVAVGDEDCVLILRVLDPLTAQDLDRLARFADATDLAVYLQPGGPQSVRPLSGIPARLAYRVPDLDLELRFLPGDFTQVNTDINRRMIDQALALLDPAPGDRVLDLFCGLGNFTLPLARVAGDVVGVEGDPGLVARAGENRERNGLHNVRFYAADLYGDLQGEPWLSQGYDRVLLDPPRNGAAGVLRYLAEMGAKRLVYVSCNPATLARDVGELAHRHGLRLLAAGVMDMFPHTGHVESIAVLEPDA